MKKVFHFILAFSFGISIMGQTINEKINSVQKTPYFKNIRDLSKEKGINRLQPIDKLFPLILNQLKTKENGDLKLDSIIGELWDDATEQMMYIYKYTFGYDANKNVNVEVHYSWNKANNKWIGSNKYEYNYDVNGNDTLSIYYHWDGNTNQWNTINKSEHTYNTNGDPVMDVFYDWNQISDDWIVSSKDEYTLDENGYVILDIFYDWDNYTEDWANSSKTECFYYANGNPILDIYYAWDETINEWIASGKNEYNYDDNDHLITWSYSLLNETTNYQWVYFMKEDYIYDLNGNKNSEIFYLWNADSSKWDTIEIMEYTYDEHGNMAMDIGYIWDETTSQYSFEVERHTYYYSEQSVTDNNIIYEKGIRIYPNPTKEIIIVETPSASTTSIIILFDLQGKQVLSQEFSGSAQISVSRFKNGIYLYNVISDGEIFRGKLSIEN